jgi:hypothetical protein
MFYLDKDMLNKVSLAYEVYSKKVRPDLHIENFISWMYKQYGIVELKKEEHHGN